MKNEVISKFGLDPEAIIQQLRISLTEIIAKSYRLKRTEEIEKTIEELKELLYKLNYAMLANDKTILSITGLQGVGKTKILRDLYKLDDELLPSDGGRGEAIPVLFTETEGLESLSYIVRRAIRNEDGIYELKDEEITLKEFNSIAQMPNIDDLWLEVLLPRTYFNTDFSIALLPGFEKNPEEHSQRYLNTLLALSTSVLLVFNHKKLARLDQQVLIEKIASEFSENRPVFALSFAEELDMEQRENLIIDLTKKFNIPESEKERIVFTGIGKELENYPKEILKAISTYTHTNASGYKKQLRMLYSISGDIIHYTMELEKQVELHKTKEIIVKYNLDENRDRVELYEIQEAFRNYRKKVTYDVKEVINKNFKAHTRNSRRKMDSTLESEKKNYWDKFKSAFKKDITFEEKLKFEHLIEEIWNGENGIESERRLISSLESYVSNEINLIQSEEPKKQIEEPVSANPLLTPILDTENSKPENNENEKIEAALSNISNYINSDENDLSITLKQSDLKVLPIVAVGITQELVAASLILEQENFSKLDETVKAEIKHKSNSLVKEFQDLALSTSTVVKGAAVFFGIDALDGTFNTFGAFTGILTTLGLPAKAAGPVGLLLIGTVGSALAINKGAQRIEKYKFERSRMADEVFQSIANSQEQSVIATMNNILNKMEDKLIETYHRRNGTDKNFGLLDELDNRIKRLQQQCGELQELAFRNESYIN